MPDIATVCFWLEHALALALFLLPPVLALVPRGAAPLTGVAGLCAAGLLIAQKTMPGARMRRFAMLLGALLAWGGLSAMWSIVPARSLLLDLRLLGLFVAALALTATVPRIATPQRLVAALWIGTAVAIGIAAFDLLTRGGLSQYVTVRPFEGPRLNQIAVWVAVTTLPICAVLIRRREWWTAFVAAAVLTVTVYLLDGTTAKMALTLGAPVAAAFYAWRRPLARVAAIVSLIAVLVAPIVLPQLAQDKALFAQVNSFKESAGHRLLIWSFAGKRIAERPVLGWGLDSSRAIPGGSEEARPGEKWLPLHPHNAALQVWLELGAPAALLLALLITELWWSLGDATWPRAYAAAAGGSFATALTVAFAGWGVWQEWWIGTLSMALFAVLLMARATVKSAIPAQARNQDH